MAAPEKATWYFGWLGEMRALPTPELNLTNREERYGGIHQGLTGKRVVDITGYRTTYEMQFRLLSEDDYEFLRMCYLNGVTRQQLFLINPMRKNLLSQQCSLSQPFDQNDLGITASGLTVVHAYANDFPPGVTPQQSRCYNLVSTSATNNFCRFDGNNNYIPMFPGVPITTSMYVRCESGTVNFNLVLDCFDKYGVTQVTTPSVPQTATTAWQRISYTFTPDSTQFGLRPAFVFPTSGTKNLHIAAPQVEYGDVVTPWEIGGGRSRVIVDQIDSTSPRFPLSDVSVTFLES